jgi:hypothetical protein
MWKWFLNKVKENVKEEILTEMKINQTVYNVDGDFLIKAGNNNLFQYMTINSYGHGTAIDISPNKEMVDFDYPYYSPSVLWYPFNGYIYLNPSDIYIYNNNTFYDN